MNEERIIRYTRKNLPKDTQTDWERVNTLTDEEIEAAVRDDPDAAPIDEDFWKDAVVVHKPQATQKISLRLDHDLYVWFKVQAKRQGVGYQTFIKEVLRSYMNAHRQARHPKKEE